MNRILRSIVVLGVLMVIAWYLYTRGESFRLLLEFDMWYLPLLLVIPLFSIGLNGLIMRQLVSEFSVKLRFYEWYGLTTLNACVNYLPLPQAGAIVRGIYLKETHKLNYSSYLGTLLVTTIQFVATVGMVGLLALSAMTLGLKIQFPWPVWGLFGVLGASVVLLGSKPWSLPFGEHWNRLVEGLEKLRHRHVHVRVALLQVSLVALAWIGFWLAFQSLGRPVTWMASLFLGLVTVVSGIVNVTPGNLGIAESVAWVTAHALEGNADEAVVAYTVLRLVTMLTVFTLTPCFLTRLSVWKKGSGTSVDTEGR